MEEALMRGRYALPIIAITMLVLEIIFAPTPTRKIKIKDYAPHKYELNGWSKERIAKRQNALTSAKNLKEALENKRYTPKYYSWSGSEEQAKMEIANHESHNDYNAVSGSGTYIGKYQLSADKLNGDHSPENQERTAEQYVMSVYGSWAKAREHQINYGWY